MGNGYTRNDTANNIADGNVINASDLDGEFDKLQTAFDGSSGHSHDGTSGEGPQIAAGGIASNAVTTAKIADLNVTTGKIANNAITSAKIPDGSITETQLSSSAAPTFGNITTTGSLRGPASFTIDPAAVGDNTGTVVIAGSLQVDGTTTTVNSTTLSVADKNIVIASGAADAAAANDAGLTVTGASATLLYKSSGDKWSFNKPLDITGNLEVEDGGNVRQIRLKRSGSTRVELSTNANEGELSLFRSSNAKNVYISSYYDSYFNGGNVGIGTTSPDLKLDVSHGTAAQYIATFQNTANNNQLKIGNQAQGYLNIQGARIDNGNAYNFSLQTDGGNVGIGTTIPDLKLHIDGVNAYPATSGTTPNGMLHLRAKTAGGTHGLYVGVANASPWGSWLQAADANNLATEYPLLLNPNGGNVGIGTTNPSKQLTISGDNTEFLLNRTGAYADTINIGMPSGVPTIVGGTDLAFGGSGTWTEHMRILSGGIFRIGASGGTGQRLSINGHAQSDTMIEANAWLVAQANGGDGIAIGTKQSSPYATWIQSGYLDTLGTSNHYALALNPHGGNVGIGTDEPASKLHLESGNAHNKLSITSTASGGTGYDAVIDLLGSASNSEVQLNMGINGDADREQIKTYQSIMSFRTGNKERMVIGSNGKVVIHGNASNWNETQQGQTTGSLHFDPDTSNDNEGNAITWGASDHSNGTVADAGIYVRSDGAYGTKMYISTTDSYAVGSTTSIKIDHAGRVTMPRQPAFMAKLTSGQTITTTNTTIGFNSEEFDIAGNHSNGTFTAPVAGV